MNLADEYVRGVWRGRAGARIGLGLFQPAGHELAKLSVWASGRAYTQAPPRLRGTAQRRHGEVSCWPVAGLPPSRLAMKRAPTPNRNRGRSGTRNSDSLDEPLEGSFVVDLGKNSASRDGDAMRWKRNGTDRNDVLVRRGRPFCPPVGKISHSPEGKASDPTERKSFVLCSLECEKPTIGKHRWSVLSSLWCARREG